MEEARRLASLQKKRELKAAGIDMREMRKKSRGINYNAEVAFEKRPTAGFYDTGEEQQLTKQMGQEFRPVTLEEMEGRRRKVCSLPSIRRPFVSQEAGNLSLHASNNLNLLLKILSPYKMLEMQHSMNP